MNALEAPLQIEQRLAEITGQRAGVAPEAAVSVPYPPYLGSLVVGPAQGVEGPSQFVTNITFTPEKDVLDIMTAARSDLWNAASHIKNPDEAACWRADTLAWVDWLARDTALGIVRSDYIDLARDAALNGDVEGVAAVVRDRRRLYFNPADQSTDINDPAYGDPLQQPLSFLHDTAEELAGILLVSRLSRREDIANVVLPALDDILDAYETHEANGEPLPAADYRSILGVLQKLQQTGLWAATSRIERLYLQLPNAGDDFVE